MSRFYWKCEVSDERYSTYEECINAAEETLMESLDGKTGTFHRVLNVTLTDEKLLKLIHELYVDFEVEVGFPDREEHFNQGAFL